MPNNDIAAFEEGWQKTVGKLKDALKALYDLIKKMEKSARDLAEQAIDDMKDDIANGRFEELKPEIIAELNNQRAIMVQQIEDLKEAGIELPEGYVENLENKVNQISARIENRAEMIDAKQSYGMDFDNEFTDVSEDIRALADINDELRERSAEMTKEAISEIDECERNGVEVDEKAILRKHAEKSFDTPEANEKINEISKGSKPFDVKSEKEDFEKRRDNLLMDMKFRNAIDVAKSKNFEPVQTKGLDLMKLSKINPER